MKRRNRNDVFIQKCKHGRNITVSPVKPFSFPLLPYTTASNPRNVILPLLNLSAPLTFFGHNLKISAHPERDMVKITETKSPLGMLEWLAALGGFLGNGGD